MSLGDALTELIFEPLRMKNTTFEISAESAVPYTKVEDLWQPIKKYPKMEVGDGGLLSTARDYAIFLQCLLNEGSPLLSTKTFNAMISNQIGDLFVTQQPAANSAMTYPFPSGDGVDKFGLGFQLHMNPEPGMRSPGSYSWCGLLNTYFWGDPVKKIGGIVLMQSLPLYSPICLSVFQGFEKRVYASLA